MRQFHADPNNRPLPFHLSGEEPLLDQPTSMDEGMDSRIIIGITIVGVIGAIAIGSFGLYRFKDQLLNWYRSVCPFCRS